MSLSILDSGAAGAVDGGFRALLDLVTDAVCVYDPETLEILDTNRANCELHGYTADEIRAVGALGLSARREPYTPERVAELAAGALAGAPQRFEWATVTRDGVEILWDTRMEAVALLGRRVLVTSARDIRGDRAAAEALRASEARFRGLFEEFPLSVQIFSPEGETLQTNRAWSELFGVTIDEVRGWNPMAEPQLAELGNLIRAGFAGAAVDVPPSLFDSRRAVSRVAGDERAAPARDPSWIQVAMRPLRGPDGDVREVFLVHQDVTALKTAQIELERANAELEERVRDRTGELAETNEALEEEVAEHEAAREELQHRTGELEAVFNALPDLYFRMDPAGRIVDFRAPADLPLAVPAETLLHRGLTDFIPPQLAGEAMAALERVRETGQIQCFTYPLPTPDGVRDYEARVGPVAGGDLIAIVRDITDAKRAERALQESEAHFRAIIENSHDIVTILDAEGRTAYQSPSLRRILGYAEGELTTENGVERMHPDDAPGVRDAVAAHFAAPGAVSRTAYRMRHRDGSWRRLETIGQTLAEPAPGRAVVFNTRDVTERWEAEQALKRSEEHFRTLIERSHDIVTILDGEGRIAFQSPSMERILGYTQDELRGLSAFELVHPDDLAPVQAAMGEIVRNPGTVARAEYRYRRKDGAWRRLETFGRTLPEGSPEGAAVFNSRDVTERWEAEQALKRSEEHFRTLIELSHDVITIVDEAGRYTYQSPSLERVLGYSAEELRGASVFALVHPEDAGRVNEAVHDVFTRPGTIVRAEYRFRHEDGSWRRLESFGRALPEGSPEGVVVFNSRDVTERWEAEQALQEREEHFRTLIENAHDVITILDADGFVTYQSPSLARVLGFEPHERDGTHVMELVHPGDVDDVVRGLTGVAGAPGTVARVEFRFRHKDGSWRRLEAIGRTLAPDTAARGMVFNTRDVTERWEAEQALQAREEHFRVLIENSHDIITVLDAEGRTTYHSPSLPRLLGFDPGEITTEDGFALIHPDDAEAMRRAVEAHVAAPGAVSRTAFRLRHKDGSWRHVETVGRTLAEGPMAGSIVFNSRDITERWEAERALIEREENFRALIENSHDVITVVDAEGRVTYQSPSLTHIFGYTPEERMGENPLELVHPDDLPVVAQGMGRVAELPGTLQRTEFRFRHKNGSWRWVESTGRTVSPETADKGSVHNTRDITERREAEEALRERERHFRRLTENASDMIQVVGADTSVQYTGPSVLRLLGYTPEEIQGTSAMAYLHPDDVPRTLEKFAEMLAVPGVPITAHYRVLHRDGRWRDFEAQAMTLASDSASEGVVVNARDVTERLAADRVLREREERFRRLIENASDIVQLLTPDATVAYSGPSIERVLGYTAEETVGTRSTELLHPGDEPRVMAAFAELVAHPGRMVRAQYRVRHRDGGWRVMEAQATTLVPHSAAEGVVVNARDVTERLAAEQALQRSEEYFRALIESAQDNIVIVDQAGVMTYHSPSVLPMLGYRPEELVGRNAFELIHPEDAPGVADELGRVFASAGYPGHVEYRFRHANGTWRRLEAFGRSLEGEVLAGRMVANVRDVTERREQEEALRIAKAEAESANLAKSEFLSRMSHELRTPLNSILGFAQLLGEADMSAGDLRAVNHILTAGEHLLNLINEVLDIARIESGRQPLSLEAVRLSQVVEDAVGMVRPLAAARGVRVVDACGGVTAAWVHADRQRLAQVLLNLLSNAVKYNRPGGSVRLQCAPTADGGVHVRVQDTGTGIAPEHRGQLFVPFARLGAEGSGVEGTGLGLALSRRLVEAMGGVLELEESSPDGSTFRVTLLPADDPVRTLDGMEPPSPEARSTEPRVATLLYVEDNLANLSLVETILERRSAWRLIPALQGRLGVEMAREHSPDLILLDLHLPDLPGDEVLRQLRADPRTAGIPIIVISADATPNSVARLRAAGANDYLTKPLNVKRFVEAVEALLPRREGR